MKDVDRVSSSRGGSEGTFPAPNRPTSAVRHLFLMSHIKSLHSKRCAADTGYVGEVENEQVNEYKGVTCIGEFILD